MAMRVKNIAAGFYNATGFHPIRSSADYDPDRAGDSYSQKTAPRRRKKAVAKRKRKPAARKRKPAARRGAFPTNIQPDTMRKHNPIPTKWVAANVKRAGNDIQVMLFPKGKVARRRASKRRAARRAAPRRRTARRRNPSSPEVVRATTVGGRPADLWRKRDAEGRVVYSVTVRRGGSRVEPHGGWIHGMKTALKVAREDYS